MKFGSRIALAAMTVLATAASAFSIPSIISYQGVLLTSGGTPVSSPTIVSFGLWDAQSGGTQLWGQPTLVEPDSDGRFVVLLGGGTPIPSTVFESDVVYLSLQIDPDPEMVPRTRIVSVGYSYRTGSVDGATGGTITSSVSIGTGHSNLADQGFVTGVNCSTFGTAAVAQGSLNNAGHYAVVSGGLGNGATGSYSTVGGGNLNNAIGQESTVGGGAGNVARGPYSTIAGGGGPASTDSNSASGTGAAIAGGRRNIATSAYAAIGGGDENVANGGSGTTIGGGYKNHTTESWATIGGGQDNLAYAWSTVAGGINDTASGQYAAIGGGFHNTASHLSCVVAGGGENIASQNYGAVGGGEANVAGGVHSTVPGGWQNKAIGSYALAAGLNARANHTGAVVISTVGSNDSTRSGGIHQMVLSASGGLYLTNTTETAPYNSSRLITTRGGAYLSGNGTTWTNASDRNAKENFESVNREELLEQIAKLDISRWNYKGERADVQHIGPVAQDFHALFNVGPDDKSISTIDPAGIALAAIQELYKKSKEVEDLRAEIAALREMVEAKR